MDRDMEEDERAQQSVGEGVAPMQFDKDYARTAAPMRRAHEYTRIRAGKKI
jgi:hypothetical protein